MDPLGKTVVEISIVNIIITIENCEFVISRLRVASKPDVGWPGVGLQGPNGGVYFFDMLACVSLLPR